MSRTWFSKLTSAANKVSVRVATKAAVSCGAKPQPKPKLTCSELVLAVRDCLDCSKLPRATFICSLEILEICSAGSVSRS